MLCGAGAPCRSLHGPGAPRSPCSIAGRQRGGKEEKDFEKKPSELPLETWGQRQACGVCREPTQEVWPMLIDSSKGPKAEAENPSPRHQVTTKQPWGQLH